MKILAMDVDRSFSSIGGYGNVEKIFGIPPVPISKGLAQINTVLSRLFKLEEKVVKHPIFGETKEPVATMLPLAQQHELGLVIIDTFSVAVSQQMRLITDPQSTGTPRPMQQSDWGTLGRFAGQTLHYLSLLPVAAVVSTHLSYDKDGKTGEFHWVPQIPGSTKDEIKKFFDVIAFTKVNQTGKTREFRFLTQVEGNHIAKDRLGLLEPEMPQDIGLIVEKYQQAGVPNPKILVIGDSGTGKTRSLASLSRLVALKKAA